MDHGSISISFKGTENYIIKPIEISHCRDLRYAGVETVDYINQNIIFSG